MKIICMLVFLILINSASANSLIHVRGEDARSIMEAFSAAGVTIENSETEWSGKVLSLKTGPITCHYNATFPDDWMTNVTCIDEMKNENIFKQSLSVAKSIYKYAYIESGLGNRWIRVESVNCSLIYDLKKYLCAIESLND